MKPLILIAALALFGCATNRQLETRDTATAAAIKTRFPGALVCPETPTSAKMFYQHRLFAVTTANIDGETQITSVKPLEY